MAAPVVAASSGNVYDCRTLPLPSGIAAGHLLVAVTTGWWETDQSAAYNANPAAGWNAPAGWTFGAGRAFTATVSQMIGFAWWYRYADGSESGDLNFTQNPVSGAGDYGDLYGLGATLRITGGPTSGNPYLETSYTGQLAAESIVMPTFTPGGDESLVLAVVHREGAGTLTQPAGWTQTVYTTGGVVGGTQQVSWYQQATAAALSGLTWTVTAAAMSDLMSVTIRPASGGSSLTATVNDTVGITDSTSRTLSAARAVADPVEITDLGSPQAMTISQTIPDPVGITDTATATQQAARTANDTVGATDTITTTSEAARGPSDPAGVTDLVAAIMSVARLVTDPVGVTDAVEAVLIGAGAALVEDQVGITDTATVIATAQRGPADPAGVTDQVTISLALARTPSDGVGITDSVTAVLTGAGATTAADTVPIADVVSVTITAARTTADQIGATDQVTTITATVRSLADGATVTDSVTAVLIGPWRDIRIHTGPATRRTIHPGRTL